ncbi:hypothetical protein ZIOFF_057873 [Zingiber officinale]|uniref:Glucan endo-1,3-beta-D-glucosidase n=1 Tax=Zingiber officinale TaxID=94328 RepID=A0A8J5KIU1_ZINOF|nr:hypothetical protein ZIOFF_057873 [Zingiber officinale]
MLLGQAFRLFPGQVSRSSSGRVSKSSPGQTFRSSPGQASRLLLCQAFRLFLGQVSRSSTGVTAIGVCYGRLGDNLPPPPESALVANNITTIKVTTSVATTVLGVSYPPSAGDFSDATKEIISSIVHFLAVNEAPILVNMYPYFAYKDNSNDISLDYALFNATGVIVQDGPFGYQNLFDSMLDAVNAALEKVGGASVGVVVSESGWPSAGDFGASVDNACIYNHNLINHVVKGTPKKPEVAIETYLFSMFNENQKGPVDLEKFFGLFFPNKTPVYQLKFA